MSTFVYHGQDRIYIGARAYLLEESRETASEWAAQHIKTNAAHAYVLGKFVEAEKANNNQQYFTLEGLQMGRPTIANSPMNINHSPRNIVGSFVASELIYPATEEAGDIGNPYVESLGVFWRYYFPDEYRVVQAAHNEGTLFYSMECVPRALRTVGGSDDSIEYPYEGIQSPNYAEEINKREVPINLVDPHFVGGALIIPPVKPGWSRAEVKSIAGFMQSRWEEAEALYNQIEVAAEDSDAEVWESLMTQVILLNEEVSRHFGPNS